MEPKLCQHAKSLFFGVWLQLRYVCIHFEVWKRKKKVELTYINKGAFFIEGLLKYAMQKSNLLEIRLTESHIWHKDCRRTEKLGCTKMTNFCLNPTETKIYQSNWLPLLKSIEGNVTEYKLGQTVLGQTVLGKITVAHPKKETQYESLIFYLKSEAQMAIMTCRPLQS